MLQQCCHSYQRFFNTCSVSNTWSAGYKNITQTLFNRTQRCQWTQQLSTLSPQQTTTVCVNSVVCWSLEGLRMHCRYRSCTWFHVRSTSLKIRNFCFPSGIRFMEEVHMIFFNGVHLDVTSDWKFLFCSLNINKIKLKDKNDVSRRTNLVAQRNQVTWATREQAF